MATLKLTIFKAKVLKTESTKSELLYVTKEKHVTF